MDFKPSTELVKLFLKIVQIICTLTWAAKIGIVIKIFAYNVHLDGF